jgi:hypothetical protein
MGWGKGEPSSSAREANRTLLDIFSACSWRVEAHACSGYVGDIALATADGLQHDVARPPQRSAQIRTSRQICDPTVRQLAQRTIDGWLGRQ